MQYIVKDPKGIEHVIDGPEGATPEQVLAQAQKLIPTGGAPAEKSEPASVDGFIDNLGEGTKRFVTGAVKMAVGAAKIPKENLDSVLMMGMGAPFKNTPTASRIQTITDGAVEAIKGIPGDVADLASPRKWYDKPVENVVTAGSIVMPFLKGAKAASIAAKVGAAGEGALLKEGASAAAKAAAEEAGTSVSKKVLAGTLEVATGVPADAVEARLKNPAAVKTAFAHHELADQMAQSVQNFHDNVIAQDAEVAQKTLSKSQYLDQGAFTKDQITQQIKLAKNDIGAQFTPEKSAAVKSVNKVMTDWARKLRNTVSQSKVKELIQDLDSQIDYGNPAVSKTNEAFIGLRVRLDKMLKGVNSAYEKAMLPVDEDMRVLQKVRKKFDIKKDFGRDYYADDSTATRIKNAVKEDKVGTHDVLSRFEKQSGENWFEKIRNANAKLAFETPGRSIGSTRSLTGMAAGLAAGTPLGPVAAMLGAAAGAVTGALANIYGPEAAGALVDVLASPKMAKYAGVLKKAALKGAPSVAATHSLLMNSDPQYSSTINSALQQSPATP